MDSGASRTILGQSGWDLLCKLNLKLSTVSSPSVVTVANGEQCSCLGTVSVPVSLCGKVKVIDMLIIPSIPQQLILGVDFWKSMDVVPHLRSNCWKFGSESIAVSSIQESGLSDISQLTSLQRQVLSRLVEEKFSIMGQSLGRTTLMEHKIEVNSAPIKQRYYPVSPAKQKIINDEIQKMLEADVIEDDLTDNYRARHIP